MIELIIAALIQLGTLTTDATTTQSADQSSTTTTTATPGGTGTWDDNA